LYELCIGSVFFLLVQAAGVVSAGSLDKAMQQTQDPVIAKLDQIEAVSSRSNGRSSTQPNLAIR
jgi:hypothetical protein